MIQLEEKIAYYINRKILIANPEFYIYEDCKIINSIIAAFDVKQLNFSDFCAIIGFPDKDEKCFNTGINPNSNIRPIFSIDKNTNVSCLEIMHYRYIYKILIQSCYKGLIIICADGKAYECNDKEVIDYEERKVDYIEDPILIYGENVSLSIFKNEKSFYKLLEYMEIKYRKCNAEYSALYSDRKVLTLTIEEYDLATRVIDDSFALGKRKDLIYYYANHFQTAEDSGLDRRCYEVFVKNNKKCWCEKVYDGCKLKFRYTIEDFFAKGLGICADTASMCNVLFNDRFGFKAYILTLRGHNIRHAVCVIPQLDMIISNMSIFKARSRVGCKSLIYLLTCFHVESVQIKDKVYYNNDYFEKNDELSEFLDYLENVYCTEFYIYHHVYKKAFSYNIIKKILKKDTYNIDNKYSIVSVIQDSKEDSEYIRIFLNNDRLIKLQGLKRLYVYFEDNCQRYKIDEDRNARANSLICLEIKQGGIWDRIKVYCDDIVIDEVVATEEQLH